MNGLAFTYLFIIFFCLIICAIAINGSRQDAKTKH